MERGRRDALVIQANREPFPRPLTSLSPGGDQPELPAQEEHSTVAVIAFRWREPSKVSIVKVQVVRPDSARSEEQGVEHDWPSDEQNR